MGKLKLPTFKDESGPISISLSSSNNFFLLSSIATTLTLQLPKSFNKSFTTQISIGLFLYFMKIPTGLLLSFSA